MGNPISGNGGDVSKGGASIAHLKKWTVSETAELLPYVTSNSISGATMRVKGNTDWTATAEVLLDSGAVPSGITVGSSYDWIFKMDASNNKAGTGMVASIDYETDVESGALVGATINIEANGALS